MTEFNLYIDESCHLEHDLSNVMTVWYIKKLPDYFLVTAFCVDHSNRPYY